MADQNAISAPVEAFGLSKTYKVGFWSSRPVHALRSLDLRVEPGELFGLLGPNGAGKSTAIKVLMNLVRPTAGRATLFGHEPASPAARRFVGFVPENPAPYEYLTGHEFVTLAAQLGGLPKNEARRRVGEVIDFVAMTEAARLQIRRYSKGMIQRIVLAQALVCRPRLLVLDEPTSGLDPIGRRLMRDIILEERRRGTAVLFCTHIIPDVEALCDRVAVLMKGRIVKQGLIQDLLTRDDCEIEVGISGLPKTRVGELGIKLASVDDVGGGVQIRLDDADAQLFIRRVIDSGGRIRSVQPVRFSLEDLFLKTLEEVQASPERGKV